jgi:hypothetical protein
MALGHAYRHAPSVHHHSGSTGCKHPASSGSQSMVDNHRFCAAAKSYRVMGFWVYALAESRQIREHRTHFRKIPENFFARGRCSKQQRCWRLLR